MAFLDGIKSKLSQRAEDNSSYRDYENEGYDTSSSAVTEEEAGYGYAYENEHYTEPKKAPISFHSLPAGNLNIIQPTCVQDVISDVVKLLKDDCIVILNLTKLENGQRTRIVDFVSGVVAALDGNIVEASQYTYTATPKSITVSTGSKPVEGVEGYMNGNS